MITNLSSGRASTAAYGPGDHECLPPARIRVDQKRQLCRVADPAHILADVIEAGDAEVGEPEGCVRHAGAGQVDGVEAGPLSQQCGVGVDGADDLQRAFRLECVPETLTG
jgi:hypothetical protein